MTLTDLPSRCLMTALASLGMLGLSVPALAAPAQLPETPSAQARPAIQTTIAVADPDWREPTVQERSAALNGPALVRAAFFERIFSHNPADAAAGLALSAALRELGHNAEAADAAHRVLFLDPKNFEALLAAARAHIGDNDAFQSVDLLHQAQALRPTDWRPHSLLGVALIQVHREPEGQAELAEALKLSPNNPAVLVNMAMFATQQGQYAQAESWLRTAVSQSGATAQMRQNLALVLGLQDKMGEAEQWLRMDLPPELVDQNLAWLRAATSAPGSVPASTPGVTPSTHSWSGLKQGG